MCSLFYPSVSTLLHGWTPNNIPLRAKWKLESGIGLINNLTLTRTLTLTDTLTLTRTLILTRTLNLALTLN